MHNAQLRTVLLRHQLPDGAFHFDWMFQTDFKPETRLATFRVTAPIHHPEIDQFDAERTSDHRSDYLTYQGPLSGGRGSVVRVASGTVEVDERSDECIRCRLNWNGRARPWIGTPVAGSVWRFVVEAAPIAC